MIEEEKFSNTLDSTSIAQRGLGYELRLATRATLDIDSVDERLVSASLARRSDVSNHTSAENPADSILRLPSRLVAF